MTFKAKIPLHTNNLINELEYSDSPKWPMTQFGKMLHISRQFHKLDVTYVFINKIILE